MLLRSVGILFCTLLLAAPASAATCGGDFNTFLSAMAREAAAAGISRAVVDSSVFRSHTRRRGRPATSL